jgi:molybdopterin synthase catalytic subunit
MLEKKAIERLDHACLLSCYLDQTVPIACNTIKILCILSSCHHHTPMLSLNRPPSRNSADQFAISFAPLSIETVYQLADDGANGAIVLMSGMVRNQTDGRSVQYLDYQAYEPMALRVFQEIAQEIRQTWPEVTHVVIQHRVGKLAIGEISVLVAVGCPHRGEAFAACQFAIDTLKHNAPIWKKEIFQDGASTWVNIGACETDRAMG